jgi:FkbM family methyltransferase
MIANVKQYIRTILGRFGYEVVKISRQSTAKPINVFTLVVNDFLEKRNDRHIFFIQVGAHDGSHCDPIRPFVTKYHWKGILVEPQPKIFKRLVANYSAEKQLIFENAAIGHKDGPGTLYTFKEGPGVPDHASMLTSFNRDRLVCNGHGYRYEIEELAVPILSVKTLLAKNGVKNVDLLQIDAEGFDFEILKMFFAAGVSPTIVNFESGIFSEEQTRKCGELLAKLGYRALTVGVDTIAYKQDDAFGFESTLSDRGYEALKAT